MKFSDKLLLIGSGVALIIILFFGEQWINPKGFAYFSQGVRTFVIITSAVVLVLLSLTIGLGAWFVVVRIKNEQGVIRSSGKSQVVAVRKQSEQEEILQFSPSQLQSDPHQHLTQFKQVAQLYSMLLRDAKRARLDTPYEEEIVEASVPYQNRTALPLPREESLCLSTDYSAPADDFLSGRKLIVGISGSGKSNTVGVYSEELGRLQVPFVLADTEDEYQPLCQPQWLPSGIRAGASGPCSIRVEDAARFGRYVLEHHLQVILNLSSYELGEAARVMIGIIAGMRAWQEERENERRIPCEFLLEEAVTWLPQYVNESPLKTQEPQTLAALQNTFFNDLVRKGRKRGLGITLVCQKIAELDNRAMQSDGKLLHRQAEEADLERYRKLGITREETLSLKNGEVFLFSSHESKRRLQIRRRFSPHGANTPGLEHLRRHQQALHKGKEAWKQFANTPEIDEISDEDGKAFDPSTEPLSGISAKFRDPSCAAQEQPKGEISEITKSEILALYQRHLKRIEIRDRLGLSGDQYWMVRDVCNEYDRQQAESKRSIE